MFKKLIKGAKKLIKGVGRAIKKVGKAVKSALKSPFVKALVIGAAVFFGVPWVAGALQVGSASAAGLTGAAWWKSTLGLGAAAAAPAAAGVAPVAGTASAAGTGMAGTVAAPFGTTAPALTMGDAAAKTLAGVQGAAQVGVTPAWASGGAKAAGGLLGGVSTNANQTLAESVGGGAGDPVSKTGLKAFTQNAVKKLGSTWSGLGDTAKAAVISGGMQAAGNVIKGYAEGAAKDEELKREEELRAAQSVYGLRRDGSNAAQAYDPAAILREATAGYQHRGLLGPTATDATLPPDPADRYRA